MHLRGFQGKSAGYKADVDVLCKSIYSVDSYLPVFMDVLLLTPISFYRPMSVGTALTNKRRFPSRGT